MSPPAFPRPQPLSLAADADDAAGKPVVRWSAVYLGLRDAILTHALTPGTKLPEDELGEVYSVSRTIVRSALQSLAHDRPAGGVVRFRGEAQG